MDFLSGEIVLWQQILRGIILVLLFISGLTLSITDMKKRIIPNSIVGLWLILGGLNLATLNLTQPALMIFPAVCFGIFFILGMSLFFSLGENKIGGGDAKLIMTMGAFIVTMNHLFWFSIISFLLSLIVFIVAKTKGIKSIPAGPIYAFSVIVPYAFYSFPYYFGIIVSLLFIGIFLTSVYALWKKDLLEPFEMVE